MIVYPVTFHNGYPLIQIGNGYTLVGTGTPATIHTHAQLDFMGMMHNVVQNYNQATIANLRQHIHPQLDTVIGMDIISRYAVLWQLSETRIAFEELKPCDIHGTPVTITQTRGIPVLTTSVNGQEIRMFLDSGTKVSYVQQNLIGQAAPQGNVQDFFPGHGLFHTDLWRLQTQVAGHACQIEYGVLPHALLPLLNLGPRGILGIDFLKKFTVCLNVRQMQATIIAN